MSLGEKKRRLKICMASFNCLKHVTWSIWRRLNAVQRIRATLYQLHQREVAAIFQPSHVRSWARRVQEGRYRLGLHGFRYGSPGLHWAHGEGTLNRQTLRDSKRVFDKNDTQVWLSEDFFGLGDFGEDIRSVCLLFHLPGMWQLHACNPCASRKTARDFSFVVFFLPV